MAPTSKQRALFNPFNACLLGGLSCHIKKMVWRRNRQESRGIDVSGVCARGFELQTCAACKQRFIFYVLGLDRRVLFFFLSFCCVRIVETGGDLTWGFHSNAEIALRNEVKCPVTIKALINDISTHKHRAKTEESFVCRSKNSLTHSLKRCQQGKGIGEYSRGKGKRAMKGHSGMKCKVLPELPGGNLHKAAAAVPDRGFLFVCEYACPTLSFDDDEKA